VDVLLASIRARIFAVTSARSKCWRKRPVNFKRLPYKPFGKALSDTVHLRHFAGALACYDRLAKKPPKITRRCPLTVPALARALGYQGLSWAVSIILNDVALHCGEEYVVLDDVWEEAQLAAGGVGFNGELLTWRDVEAVRKEINASGRAREAGGSLRKTEACHAICEFRQFQNKPVGSEEFWLPSSNLGGILEFTRCPFEIDTSIHKWTST